MYDVFIALIICSYNANTLSELFYLKYIHALYLSNLHAPILSCSLNFSLSRSSLHLFCHIVSRILPCFSVSITRSSFFTCSNIRLETNERSALMAMSSLMTYFNAETFLDGTGRGKSSRQVKFTLRPNAEAPCTPSLALQSSSTEAKKKHRRVPPTVCVDVSLPLPSTMDRPEPISIPCAQFPAHYVSPTSLAILHWSKYHGRNISFYLKDLGYFSTADRSDAKRCREDFRYLKRLIYNIDDVRQFRQMNIEFDLNIGSAYLNPTEPSTSLDAMLWWISQHKGSLVDRRGRYAIFRSKPIS